MIRIFSVAFILFLFVSVLPVHAASGGLLVGKTIDTFNHKTGGASTGTWNTSSNIVMYDKNVSGLSSGVRYTFASPVTLGTIKIAADGDNWVLKLKDSSGTVLLSTAIHPSGIGTVVSRSFPETYNVKSFEFVWDTGGSMTLGNLDFLSTGGLPPPDVIPPDNVSGLTVVSKTFNTVNMSFLTPSDSDFDKFKVYNGSTLIYTSPSGSAKNSTLTYTVSGLTADTSYTFKITSIDLLGNESSGTMLTVKTNPPPDITPPAVPSGLTALPSNASATLHWTANTDFDLAGYNVYKNGVKVNSSLITSTDYMATGLTNNNTFYWKITAVDTSGNESAPSTQVSTLFDTISPMAPIALTAVVSSPGVAYLSWSANTESDLAGYNVYKNAIKANGSMIVVPSYTASGLSDNVNYTFTVSALDTSGNESAKSLPVTYNFDTIAPSVPTNLKAVGGNQKVTLTWNYGVDSDLKGYFIYDSVGSRVNVSPLYVNSYEFVNLAYDTTYSYQISAVDISGNESAKTPLVSAKTTILADTTPPITPRGITVTNGNESGKVSWYLNTEADLAGYFVFLDGVRLNATPITVNFYDFESLVNGQHYSVRISAVDQLGNESSESVPVTLTPSTKSIPPVSIMYQLLDVAKGMSSWFNSFWTILAFAIAIPMSFVIGRNVKGLF